MFKDPIVEEVRAARRQHAARFDYDLRKIAEDLRRKELQAGRKIVTFSSKPARNESVALSLGEETVTSGTQD
ncbi:MAG: hypothetical protein AB1646_15715 [Thermodesulfobacteriota bacterium]